MPIAAAMPRLLGAGVEGELRLQPSEEGDQLRLGLRVEDRRSRVASSSAACYGHPSAATAPERAPRAGFLRAAGRRPQCGVAPATARVRASAASRSP